MPGLLGAQGVLDQGGFQIGQSIERDLAVGVAQHHGGGAVPGIGPQMDARSPDEPGADPEPAGRVVIAGDHDGRHTDVREPVQHVIEQLDGRERRDGPVVHITRDQDGVNIAFPYCRHQMVEIRGLRVEHRDAVE